MNPIPDAVPLDWSHTYLLGWCDSNGKRYLSSWSGDSERVEAVVIGYNPKYGPPLWNAPVPPSCKAYRVPSHVTQRGAQVEYATSLGGVYAFGWVMSDTIDRTPKVVK